MTTKKITEYNPQAFKENYIEFSDWDAEPVKVTLTFINYTELGCKINALLYAIESIGNNTDTDNIFTCSSLAEICRKLIPTNEFELLDSLLIKRENNKNQFVKI